MPEGGFLKSRLGLVQGSASGFFLDKTGIWIFPLSESVYIRYAHPDDETVWIPLTGRPTRNDSGHRA
jgi:hypothetical protein